MAKRVNYLFFFGILTFFIANTYVKGKVFQGTFNIKKNEKIHYLTKFSCNIGTCQFKIKMRLKDNIYEKLTHNYYKLSSELLNDKEDNTNNNLFNMNYDNAYYVLTSNKLEFIPQRITLILDNEQRYINKDEKCFSFGKLRNTHNFNLPFNFKYYDLVNSKTYDKLKNFINNKYTISFNKIYSELKNNKLMQSEMLNYTSLGNEKNSNYENKDITAKTTHRVHVWFLMFDDCYDSLINNLKLSIKTKIAYWEYLSYASKLHDISSLAYAKLDDDTKFYSSNIFDKKTFLESPKRLLFLEKNFTKVEVGDMSFFIKYHNFDNMKSFINMYNNLYKNGFYEKIIDHIYENDGFTVEYEVNIFQTNKSHFSYELQYSPILTFILTVLYIFLIFQYGSKIIQNVVSKKHKHGMILCVTFVILIQLLSNSLLFIHLLVYSKNGIGIHIFKIFFNLLNFLAQIVMCTMLLSLSYGLTIFESSFNIFIRIKVIFSLITFFHIVLVILDNTYIMESSSKYFDNDNITGYIIVFLRIILTIIYHVNINNLFLMSKISPIRRFLKKMYIFGIFYILSFPIIFMICYIFDTYWRQRFMLFGTSFLQFVSTYFITKMFLTNSEYFKVSDLSASDLPGATSSWFNQKFHAY
ncbi:integral membrane protein GPR180, putative [Plasmodium relictum]|uniref:Integral membrane protein GPR180, putative n=1 Tax=Plasmodium relictum TaxID=85471 RepID=A0A1J1HAW5_PLARL|nr:integral membrane protein GPR180, putative [Plasmodium relictum]CRH02564.1 integral membrane protein GPR180, putative [Plasmodium relictum]